MARRGESIPILHIDDDSDFAEITATFLERENSQITVHTATTVPEATELFDNTPIDCIVSDYDLPGTNGIEFLGTVRRNNPELPFILFTGKGSEEVASNAISAGVTDYLQKQSGTTQYTVLANRITNLVDQYDARTQLAEHEHRLNLFFEQSPVGVVRWDDEFNFDRVNDKAATILGYEPDELEGKPWDTVIREADQPEIQDVVVEDLLANEGGYHSINRNIRKDGEEIICEWHNWVVTDETGCVVAVYSQFQDISERKEREREIKRTRERFETVFEASNDAIFIIDLESESIIDANPQAVDLLGYSHAELVSSVSLSDIHPDDIDQYRAFLDNVAEGDIGQRGDFQCVTKSGETRACEISVGPAEMRDNQYVIATVRDISERKAREEQLTQQNERLEEFASVVSHDLRNPLRVAEGALELVADDCESDHVNTVERALDRMNVLIEDLLLLARHGLEEADIEPVDLASVVKACWSTVETDGATLGVVVDRVVRADKNRLRQLFENLFRNAIEHAGADVTVTVGELPDGFFVADDGPEIPVDEHEKVFAAGYSTIETGTGFGLSIVKEVVEAHGWELSVGVGRDGGARFEITDVEFVSE